MGMGLVFEIVDVLFYCGDCELWFGLDLMVDFGEFIVVLGLFGLGKIILLCSIFGL